MEITGIQGQQSVPLPGMRGGEVAPPSQHKSEVDSAPVRVGAAEHAEMGMSDQKRMEAIRRAVEQARDMFVVSDTRFTIFKDASGQFVTRFTNLRDGSITYYPEPDLMRHLQQAGVDTSLIQVSA